MNALVPTRRTPAPTADEPLPTLAGTPGLGLLRSFTARRLAETPLAPDARRMLDEACRETLACCRPASLADIAVELERLGLHYPMLRRSEAEAKLAVRDWAEDLADHPPDLIREAARLWRNSTAERYPTPGQLKALVARAWEHRQRLAARAQDYLRLAAADDRRCVVEQNENTTA